MSITVATRRLAPRTIATRWPGATVLDVTSKGPDPWVRFSPFYPHGGIPVPGSPGVTAQSVEGVWQALKVFEHSDVDAGKLDITTMRNIKRTTRRHGSVVGHRAGLRSDEILNYLDARQRIYLPTYDWVLTHRLADLVTALRDTAADGDVVLLDYNTNGDVADLSSPLSHAALVARRVEELLRQHKE
ncbi:DUF6939 family protein [Actinokineospora globicatena]|uniref:Uncharacterized protein n=1 Tax=Actinokineospora globicatena TaxID=103729 RepID=A0A9W6QKL2_9PSEU|nr:hypothetical protein [Actinokineospora globicatena]GLW90370.1 hypothetical protein Aglo03_11860 [Actinokineospora globicatena]